jgi:hypothetical protein
MPWPTQRLHGFRLRRFPGLRAKPSQVFRGRASLWAVVLERENSLQTQTHLGLLELRGSDQPEIRYEKKRSSGLMDLDRTCCGSIICATSTFFLEWLPTGEAQTNFHCGDRRTIRTWAKTSVYPTVFFSGIAPWSR